MVLRVHVQLRQSLLRLRSGAAVHVVGLAVRRESRAQNRDLRDQTRSSAATALNIRRDKDRDKDRDR